MSARALLLALGLTLWALFPAGVRADAASGYDQAVKDFRNVEISFGHDVDLQGAVWDFAKTLVDKVELPADSANKVKSALLNATDFWSATQDSVAAGEGMSESALSLFVVKTMLDNLSPKDVVRVKQIFGLSKSTTQAITKYGVGVLEGGAQAAGEAAEGDLGAVQTLVLATVDTVCPQCAIARKGVLLTYEAARAVEAWVQDDTTKTQYANWKAWAQDGATTDETFLTTPGFFPTLQAAKAALTRIHEGQGLTGPPSEEEVIAFVKHRFESWKRAEDQQQADADLLEQARDACLGLSATERLALGGRTDEERAAAFAKSFLDIHDRLLEQKGDRPFPAVGRQGLIEDAARLAGKRAAEGDSAYYGALLDILKRYGWTAAIPQDRLDAVKERLSERMSRLSPDNLMTFLDYAGVSGTTDLYGCLCGSVWGNLVKRYDPGPGGPCYYGGFGEWHAGFPTDKDAWRACLADTRIGDQSFADHLAERIIQWPGLGAETGTSTGADAGQQVCPPRPPEPDTPETARAAAGLYDAWPGLFSDVAADKVIYAFDQTGRELIDQAAQQIVQEASDVITGFASRIGGEAQAATDPVAAFLSSAMGYLKILAPGELDLRLDAELMEFGFQYNPETGKMEVSEALLKYPVFGAGGPNAEIAVGVEDVTGPDGRPMSRWNGKMKIGFSAEPTVPTGKESAVQVEGKYGIEIDTNKIGITSLDDTPPPDQSSYAQQLRSSVEDYLAAVDFYFGGALGPTKDVAGHKIAVGPEVTWSVKDIYSDLLFADMQKALDGMLVQQKAVEEKRHEVIRGLAGEYGIDTGCMTSIGEVTRAIHGHIVEEAARNGIATKDREIWEIRKELVEKQLLPQ